MHFISPEGDINFRITLVGFVDNLTTITLAALESTLQELLQPTESDAQLWNDILFTSGGRLEITKCGYHTIYFDFQSNGIPVMPHSTNQTNPNGNVIPVRPKNIYQPRRNLGHFKSPAGKFNTQAKVILQKAQSISKAISQSPVSQEAAFVLYHTVYRPAVEYVLGQSFMTTSQLYTIEKLSLPLIINKCGFAKTTHRALVFGPPDIAGGGFIPL